MEYAAGIVLALLVALMAARAGLDRDRAFYPTVLIVVASYYDLFAIVAGSLPALGLETLSLAAFVGLALVGFRRNLWIVVVALFAHGGLDLVHGRLIANPGVPAWWPMFCLTYDWTAALGLAWTLCRPLPTGVGVAGGEAAPERFPHRIRRAVSTELLAARGAEQSGNWAASFHHLERAHILGQASTAEHVRVHGRMLGWAVRRGDAREGVAQVMRLAGAATKTLFGLVPTGNPGGGNVGPFQSFPVPEDLAETLARARPPAIPRRIRVMLAIGVLLACGLAVRAAVAAPSDVRFATFDGRKIAYWVMGAGQPVIVMIAGLGDGMDSFKSVAPDLAKAATVIVYDRAGYGFSDPTTGAADAKAAAGDLSGVLAQSGIRGPYVLVGHSLGGLYAQYYAAHYPDQVAGLVLVESRAANFTRRCEAAAISMCAPTGMLVRFMPKGAQDEVAGLPSTVAQVESSDFGRGMRALVLSRRVGPKPSAFDALWTQTQSDLAARYAGATHLIAPGGGHFVHRDQRDWFVSAVRRFYAASKDRP